MVIRCITSFYHLIRIYHGNIAIKNGQAKVFDYILSEKRENNLYLIFNIYKTDCVDNFKENFTFTDCLNSNETFKCDNGHCYNLTIFNDQTSNCNASEEASIGYWNPTFPSQDYWKFVNFQKFIDTFF